VEEPQGLGIGIDFGEVSVVDVNGELTVVGSPVVYACRLAAAPAGVTLLNEQAYQELSRRGGCGDFEQLVLPTKDRKMLSRIVPRHWSQNASLPHSFYWT
jgi:class 3 adenylate cyclase